MSNIYLLQIHQEQSERILNIVFLECIHIKDEFYVYGGELEYLQAEEVQYRIKGIKKNMDLGEMFKQYALQMCLDLFLIEDPKKEKEDEDCET